MNLRKILLFFLFPPLSFQMLIKCCYWLKPCKVNTGKKNEQDRCPLRYGMYFGESCNVISLPGVNIKFYYTQYWQQLKSQVKIIDNLALEFCVPTSRNINSLSDGQHQIFKNINKIVLLMCALTDLLFFFCWYYWKARKKSLLKELLKNSDGLIYLFFFFFGVKINEVKKIL